MSFVRERSRRGRCRGAGNSGVSRRGLRGACACVAFGPFWRRRARVTAAENKVITKTTIIDNTMYVSRLQGRLRRPDLREFCCAPAGRSPTTSIAVTLVLPLLTKNKLPRQGRNLCWYKKSQNKLYANWRRAVLMKQLKFNHLQVILYESNKTFWRGNRRSNKRKWDFCTLWIRRFRNKQ